MHEAEVSLPFGFCNAAPVRQTEFLTEARVQEGLSISLRLPFDPIRLKP